MVSKNYYFTMQLKIIFIVLGILHGANSNDNDPLGDENVEQERPARGSYTGSHYRSESQYNSGSRQYEEQPYSEKEEYKEERYQNKRPNYNIIHDTCPFDCERADSVEFVQSLAVPIFEYYNSAVKDHRYTIVYVGDTKDGYKYVRQICRAYRYEYAGTTPIWYGYSSSLTDSGLTNNLAELIAAAPAYQNKGIIFYLYTKPDWYTIPLYRYLCQTNTDHIYTISFDEFGADSNGCKLEGILGWCLPNLPNYGNMGPYQYGPPRPGYGTAPNIWGGAA